LIREGQFAENTAGVSAGFLQANLVVLPYQSAFDFLTFCQRNPKPCPLLAVGKPGDPSLPTLGDDIDIRSDVSRYRVFRDGNLVEEVSDIRDIWRDDLVTFAIGCSFSWEEALVDEGVPVRHVEQGRNVSMYRTNVATESAGPFAGDLVVSMRPLRPDHAIRAIQITSRFPLAHGAPVHFGDPEAIGITDLAKPDYGDAVEIRGDEVPVFWACGVTPQVAILGAGLDFCVTHMPGCMLVTDVPSVRTAIF
jgi:uncharacterized protein YcsI (UPF0317 family)